MTRLHNQIAESDSALARRGAEIFTRISLALAAFLAFAVVTTS
jgi:hypothetical protein